MSLGTDKAWRNGKKNTPYQVLWLLLAQWKTQKEKISIYTTWIWPRTSETRANSQTQHWLLSLVLGALGPCWPVLPWLGFAPMGGGSSRAQCHEVPAQGGPAHTLGKQQGRGRGNTSSPLSPPGPMAPPHHTLLFSFAKGMSFSMKSYKVVEDLVFSKPSHSRSHFFACTPGHQANDLGVPCCRRGHPKIAALSAVGFAGEYQG